MSRAVFDDTTPLELQLALKDKADYLSKYEYIHLDLLRYHAVVQRNKGLQERHQTTKLQKFYEFPWERKEKKIEIPDWKALDDKYK